MIGSSDFFCGILCIKTYIALINSFGFSTDIQYKSKMWTQLLIHLEWGVSTFLAGALYGFWIDLPQWSFGSSFSTTKRQAFFVFLLKPCNNYFTGSWKIWNWFTSSSLMDESYEFPFISQHHNPVAEENVPVIETTDAFNHNIFHFANSHCSANYQVSICLICKWLVDGWLEKCNLHLKHCDSSLCRESMWNQCNLFSFDS